MFRKPHRTLLLATLLVVFVAFIAFGDSCTCLDAPDDPCILQWLVLEKIVIPCKAWNGDDYVQSSFHDEIDESGTSEAWIILQVDPVGACKGACQQVYVWYQPNIEISSDKDIELVPSGAASSVIFSMQECTPASGYAIRMAIVEEDETYSGAFERVSRLMSPRSGGTSPWIDDTNAWSTRSLAADNCIDLIWKTLTSGTSNDDITGIAILAAPDLDPDLPQLHDRMTCLYADEGYGQIHVSLHAYSEQRDGITGCASEDAEKPTRAEQHQTATSLESVSKTASAAPKGRTVHTAGASGVPPGVSKMTTINRSTSHRGSSGTTTFKERVIHLEFPDFSDYIFWESIKEERDAEGKLLRRTVNRGDSSSRNGSKRSKVRGETTDISRLLRTYRLRGYTPGNTYTVPASIVPEGGEPAYDSIEIAIPRGSTLDLSTVAAALEGSQLIGVASDGITAGQAITLFADDITLPEGIELCDLFDPLPVVEPGIHEIELQLLDTFVVSVGEQRIAVPLVNLSDKTQTVTLQWSDSRGWATPTTLSLRLPPGGSALLEVPIIVPESASAVDLSSQLVFTTSGSGLDPITDTVLLLIGLPTVESSAPPTDSEPDAETPPADESPDATTSPEDGTETPPEDGSADATTSPEDGTETPPEDGADDTSTSTDGDTEGEAGDVSGDTSEGG